MQKFQERRIVLAFLGTNAVTSAKLKFHYWSLFLVQEPAVQTDDKQQLRNGDDQEDNH
jgi:hypothetical protein